MVNYVSLVVPRSYPVSDSLSTKQVVRPSTLASHVVGVGVNFLKVGGLAFNGNYGWLPTSLALKLEQMYIGHLFRIQEISPPFEGSGYQAHVPFQSGIHLSGGESWPNQITYMICGNRDGFDAR
jgi:hypothetical protein